LPSHLSLHPFPTRRSSDLYRDWGGEGQPLVLLHGLASNARIWDLVAPRLAAHFRVLALDQRSHGLTDPAEDGYDFPSIVRDLQADRKSTRLNSSHRTISYA